MELCVERFLEAQDKEIICTLEAYNEEILPEINYTISDDERYLFEFFNIYIISYIYDSNIYYMYSRYLNDV